MEQGGGEFLRLPELNKHKHAKSIILKKKLSQFLFYFRSHPKCGLSVEMCHPCCSLDPDHKPGKEKKIKS